MCSRNVRGRRHKLGRSICVTSTSVIPGRLRRVGRLSGSSGRPVIAPTVNRSRVLRCAELWDWRSNTAKCLAGNALQAEIMTRVIYLSNIPAPYAVERFSRLASLPQLEFSAAFLERSHPERSWAVDERAWKFDGSYLGSGTRGAAAAARLVASVRPDVLITLYDRPEFLTAVGLAWALRIPVMFKVMKTFDTWVKRQPHKEMTKRLLFPRVDIHTTGPDGAAYARAYGASRVHELPEPANVRRLREGAAEARASGARLGTGTTFLYVGRLWYGKGLQYLIPAFRDLRASGRDVTLVVVGDGIDEARLRTLAAGEDRIRFIPFMQADALPAIYGAVDALVFPTLGDPYGHVVQEAMAAGLPVIATSAAGDIRERIVDGETGLVVPPADTRALTEGMRRLTDDPANRLHMGAAAEMRMRERSVEWWCERLAEIICTIARRRS